MQKTLKEIEKEIIEEMVNGFWMILFLTRLMKRFSVEKPIHTLMDNKRFQEVWANRLDENGQFSPLELQAKMARALKLGYIWGKEKGNPKLKLL